jgi:hypothetical protein
LPTKPVTRFVELPVDPGGSSTSITEDGSGSTISGASS